MIGDAKIPTGGLKTFDESQKTPKAHLFDLIRLSVSWEMPR